MIDRFTLELFQKNNRFYLFCYGIMALACAFFVVARYTGWFQVPGIGSEMQPEYVEFAAAKRFVTIGFLEEKSYGYALLERFVPDAISLPTWPAWVFWAMFVPCFAIALACSTYTSGLGFYVCLTVVTLMAGLFLPDRIFGGNDWAYRGAQLGMIALISGGVYFFKDFRTDASFGHRVFYFLVINLIWIGLVAFTGVSGINLHTVAGYAVLPLAVLTVLFILQSAYTLPYLGLQLAVRQNLSSTLSYTIMMMFLGGNLFVYYQHSRGLIEGFLFYLDPLLVLCVSALLGYSTFRDFSENGANFFRSNHPMSWAFYPAWGAIAMLTVAFAAATDNGPLLEVFEDSAALFGTGACIIFLFYSLLNFWEGMWRSLRVDKVFFEPFKVPLFMLLAGTLTFWVFFFIQTDRYMFRQVLAGRFMAIADAAWQKKDFQEAELFYLKVTDYDAYAFRSSYLLSIIAGKRNDSEEQLRHLSDAVKAKPRPSAYLQLGNQFSDEGKFFEALNWYQEGLTAFPENAELLNNMTIHLSSTSLTDSAGVAMRKLIATGKNTESVQANLVALLALKKISADLKEFIRKDALAKTSSGEANLALWEAVLGRLCANIDSSAKSKFNEDQSFLTLFSLATTCPSRGIPDSVIQQASLTMPNATEDAAYLQAVRTGAKGDEAQAFKLLRSLARESSFLKSAFYQAAIVRALERGGVDQARELLFESAQILPAGFSQSIWLDVSGYPREWMSDTIAPSIPLAQQLFSVAKTTPEQAESLPEDERFLWLVANRDQILPLETARTILSFKTADLSWSALAAVSELFLREKDYASLTDLTTRISGNMPKAQTPEIEQAARIRMLDGWLAARGLAGFPGRPAIILQTENTVVDAAMVELIKPDPAASIILKAFRAFPFRGYLLAVGVEKLNLIGKKEAAYQLALDAYQAMPETEAIARTYILQSAKMDYDTFAASALERYAEHFGPSKANILKDSLHLQPGERPAELSL